MRADLEALVPLLKERGFEVIGPVVRDGAILYAPIERLADLPTGWTADQEAGRYRLRRRDDQALFGFGPVANSWKAFLRPPVTRLFTAHRDGSGFQVEPDDTPPPRQAFLGVRACDLEAMAIQSRVLAGGTLREPQFEARRAAAFVVAVACTASAPTCFCASMGPWRRDEAGFDLRLTEILEGGHRFLVEAATPAGIEVAGRLPGRPATPAEIEAAVHLGAMARDHQTRSVDLHGLRDRLYAAAEHPRWQQVAERCLACTNCTMVCPTCFCTTVDDTSAIDGGSAARWRRWDSCFTLGFSYIHGGSVRASVAARYRQWLMHKLATWQDQFGTPGCTGCGRCITWCPAAIDITEEARAIAAPRETPPGPGPGERAGGQTS